MQNTTLTGDEKNSTQVIICPDCDLLVSVPLKMKPGKMLCPCCDHLLLSTHTDTLNRLISYIISALIFFLLSLSFPFMSYDAGGIERTISLVHSVTTLLSQNYWFLAGLIAAVILLLPFLFLCGLLYVLLPLKFARQLAYSSVVLKFSLVILPWSMVEVFLVSVFVSIIKLSTSASIGLGLSFYAFAFFSVFLTAVILLLDAHQIWNWLTPCHQSAGKRGTAISQQLTTCHICHCSVPVSQSHCQRCNTTVSARKPFSIQRTLAFLSVAILLYIPANLLPIMQTRIMGKDEFNTILGGILVLWQHGSYPVAFIIFIASILVPIAKMIALGWLSFSVIFQRSNRLREKAMVYRITEFIGRWSMLDVFVVALLVSLIHQGRVLAVYPGPAIIAFAGVIIFTILAAMSFDTRLLWDQRKNDAR
ncbi:MAG: paraquat-inducible protein A [Gammaproteobacteria bacterium]|nr:paraquat-inducible protein A [Gammaproteobacteria bacterium]